jgi:hypothetical protein
MDGTLIENKHIVAISIDCLEGGHQCQMAKNLVPLGLFEVQEENTELLRKNLPVEFINDIKSVRHISIHSKKIPYSWKPKAARKPFGEPFLVSDLLKHFQEYFFGFRGFGNLSIFENTDFDFSRIF